MRNNATVLIYIDIQRAMDSGLKFFVSDNGVVLTEGDTNGFLSPQFFSKVEDKHGRPMPEWKPPQQSAETMKTVESAESAKDEQLDPPVQ